MGIGALSLYLAFAAALVAALLAVWRPSQQLPILREWSRRASAVHLAALLVASGVLVHALFSGNFFYRYVYTHTDRALAWPYRLSAFWAGPQGSLLFWALGGGFALLVIAHARKLGKGDMALATLAASQSFLLWLTIVDSPFQVMTSVPLDGRGINALLLNPWMIIHPPVILLGYALLAVPMAYAVGALFSEDYRSGIYKAMPWTLLAWLLLGAGILIGGIWAYQVLGWGGYWAWDPVENSSLVPWLTAGALIHGLLVQRRRGSLLRANYFLAITTYLLVLVATFVTRSGLLADFSVHAFAQSPVTRSLGVFILSFAALGYGSLVWRFAAMGNAKQEVEGAPLLTEGNVFGLGMLLLVVSAGMILLGTLTPIVTGFFGIPATVESSFYTTTNGPIALALMALMGGSLLLNKKRLTAGQAEKELMWPMLLMAGGLVVAFAFGIRSPFELLFIGVGIASLVINAIYGWRTFIKLGVGFAGGHIAHLGLVLILLGFLISGNHATDDFIYLMEGQAVDGLGYTFLWQGYDTSGRQQVTVRKGSFSGVAKPVISKGNDFSLREPGIERHLFTDIYLSPTDIMAQFDTQIVVGEGRFFVHGEVSLQLVELVHNKGHDTGEAAQVEAVVLVRYLGDQQIIRPRMIVKEDRAEYVGIEIPHTDDMLFLQAVDAEQRLAWFTVGDKPAEPLDVLVLELKLKPMVIIMAYGSVLLLLGTALACRRRFSGK